MELKAEEKSAKPSSALGSESPKAAEKFPKSPLLGLALLSEAREA